MELYPAFIIKDLVLCLLTIDVLLLIMLKDPEYFVNYINWVPANPSQTPAHITPEWYFLPFYGIVKAIPSKVFGILGMVITILLPFFVPFFLNRF